MVHVALVAVFVLFVWVAMGRIERMRPQKQVRVKRSEKSGRRVSEQPAMRQPARIAAPARWPSYRRQPR